MNFLISTVTNFLLSPVDRVLTNYLLSALMNYLLSAVDRALMNFDSAIKLKLWY